MAAASDVVHESSPKTEADDVKTDENESTNVANFESKRGSDSNSDSRSELKMQDIVDMLSNLKLNPMAKEFFPSSWSPIYDHPKLALNYFAPAFNYENYYGNGIEAYPNNNRRRNNNGQRRKRMNERASRAQSEDSVRRTVYVSDLDHNVTEEQLAALFSSYGQVLDCRVCGDPHSRFRFAFVEFSNENSAKAALNLCGAMLGFLQLRVLPSKTAILPVNPTFLPRSDYEREMCARTVYCTNIDKQVSEDEVKAFFEIRCGEVSRLRLLGDHVHSTHIAFVEFVMAESAILALDCCGQTLGTQQIRVSPSKTPVRPRVSRTF